MKDPIDRAALPDPSRCATCGGVVIGRGPCPGCLFRLALDDEDDRRRSPAWTLAAGMGMGAMLGASATVLVGVAVAAILASSARVPAVADPGERAAVVEERQADAVAALDEARREVERARAELEMARIAVDARDVRPPAVPLAPAPPLPPAPEIDRAREQAMLAAERAHADAQAAYEAARHQAILDHERTVRAAERAAAEAADAAELHARGVPPASAHEIATWEPKAVLGKLTPAQIAALDAAMSDHQASSAYRESVSRMLLVNAYSAGRTDEWERRARAHVLAFPDADLNYKLALHLSKKSSVAAAADAITHADGALALRTVWTGATYTSRVYTLHKLKAVAAQRQWQDAEAAGSPQAAALQRTTGVYAREWFELAKVAGKDPATAQSLCRAAMGPQACP